LAGDWFAERAQASALDFVHFKQPCRSIATRRRRKERARVLANGDTRSASFWLSLAGALAIACGGSSRRLRPVALPDLARVDPAVQAQARERYGALTLKIADGRTAAADLASAYGQYGMLLHAARYHDAAEPCYLNAETLAPDELRWPYYLAHLYRSRGETDRAEASFKRALALRPDDVPTLVWLGRLTLDQSRPDEAKRLFSKVLALTPYSVAALAGLGRAKLATRDFAGAVRHLEQALTIDPTVESLHSPLAMAYRGLGQLDKAVPHLRQWKNTDIPLRDPLQHDLDLVLESGLSYELRGVRALGAKDFKSAAGFFRKGVELTPENTPLRRSLQHKLGTALFMNGEMGAAAQQFEQVVRAAPPDAVDESAAKAHYSLGVLMASGGTWMAAVEHFSGAVRSQPNYVEARLALAEALRRGGRLQPSLAEYEEAVRINPRSVQGRVGYAMSLAALGRYARARDWLNESVRLQPDERSLPHALARLLATAPDDRVRDGGRALGIVQELMKGARSTDLGETLAMALAELGRFDDALGVQRDVMAAAQRSGLAAAVRRMDHNLKLYERRQPCRTPWTNDEAVVLPSSPESSRQPAAR
jgi:tetratricopeptide (TPR) repeat protein